jgi:hypothetical protein
MVGGFALRAERVLRTFTGYAGFWLSAAVKHLLTLQVFLFKKYI